MNKNTISLKDNTPKINFGSLKSRKYSVSIKYFEGKEKTAVKRIDYETQIFITPRQGSYLLDISKQDIWFNQHESDSISEMIASELSQLIYPVQVRIDESGLPLNGISNFNQISSKWHRNKLKATEKYTTAISKSFYNAFERNLESENIFENSMQYDWCWNLLFHPKYINYGNEHSVKTTLYLAVIPYEYPLQFTGKQKIQTEITDYNSVEIHFMSDEMIAHEYFIAKNTNVNAEHTFYMRLNVHYDLDIYHLFPMHTRAYFEVYSKDKDGNETSVKRIEFTQYQQDTENNKTAPPEKRSRFEVYEEEDREIYKTFEGKKYTRREWLTFEDEQYKIYTEKKTKKGFWDFLR